MTVLVVAETSIGTPYDDRSPAAFETSWFSGSGAGGQHRNKTQNSVRLKHLPSGIVQTAQTRTRENSLRLAMVAITAELDRLSGSSSHGVQNAGRREAIGCGERSDKRRTFRFQDGKVSDHRTGKSARIEQVMAGHFPLLW